MVEKGYVDVNVFVYWLGGHPEFGGKAKEWIEKIKDGRSRFYTSALTIYEALVVLAGLSGRSLRDHVLTQIVVDAFSSLKGLRILELRSRDFGAALGFMEKYALDFEDAVHLAAAARSNVDFIVSNDSDFDRTPYKRVF